MAGPLIQQPPGQVFDIQTDAEGKVIGLRMRPEWASFLQAVQQVTFGSSRTGSTSARPTSDFVGRYEGMPFFDRSLGYPVFLKHASSNVWVNGAGAVV